MYFVPYKLITPLSFYISSLFVPLGNTFPATLILPDTEGNFTIRYCYLLIIWTIPFLIVEEVEERGKYKLYLANDFWLAFLHWRLSISNYRSHPHLIYDVYFRKCHLGLWLHLGLIKYQHLLFKHSKCKMHVMSM